MRLTMFAPLLMAGSLMGQPHTISGNFPRDLMGPQDTRMAGVVCNVGPCIWGVADSAVMPIKFNPPAGYHVRILRLRGDLVAWIKLLPGEQAEQNSTAGTLLGFSTTAPGGSVQCDYCADNTSLYVQDAVTAQQPKARTPFDYDGVDQVLEHDNILNVVIAEWLNTTGKPIHLEATYTIKFVYEPDAVVEAPTK
jgi:hypothetical protein